MSTHQDAVESFWDAAWHCKPTPMQWAGQLTRDEGYEVQFAVSDLYAKHGLRRYGWKVAATSQAVQAQLGVTEPGIGSLLESGVSWSGGSLSIGKLIKPHIECELAFRVNSRMESARNVDEVLDAVDFVYPAFEYIEKRVSVLDFGLGVADNAEHTGIVLGRPVADFRGISFSEVSCSLFHNKTLKGSATGEAVLGNPLNSLLWIRDNLRKYGRGLRAGELVMTGSFLRQLPIQPGDVVRAEFGGVGAVEIKAAD